MTTFSAKNQFLETPIKMLEVPRYGITLEGGDVRGLSEFEFNTIKSFGTYYYLTNQLYLFLDDNENIFNVTSISSIDAYWNDRNDKININAVELITNAPRVLRLSVPNSTISYIKNILGTEFGVMVLQLEFKNTETSNTFTKKYALKVTTNAVFSTAPGVSEDIPDIVSDNIYTTSFLSFESLFIPNLTGTFVYNSFEINENDFSLINERNYDGYALRDIPKYIELTWDKAPKYISPVTSSESTTESSSNVGNFFIDGFMFTLNSSSLGGFIMGGDSRTAEDTDSVSTSGTLQVRPELQGVIIESDIFGTNIPQESELSLNFIKSDYVGYVLYKERYDNINEVYEPIDIIVLADRNNNKWIDWKVAYGEVYRYKVRSIFRFVNSQNLLMYRDSDQLFDFSSQSSLFEHGIKAFPTYYFDSKYSNEFEIETVEYKKPNPPGNIQIFPNSYKKQILITWTQKNENKDIIGFNIYKKTKDTFFKKINTELIDIRNNFFIDSSIDFEIDYIYAVESIDVHDNFSSLSAQYQAKITYQNFETQRCEIKPFLFENEGLSLLNLEVQKEKKENNTEYFNDSFKLVVNPLVDSNDTFLLKILSLDTGIQKELKINFTITTIYHRNRT